MVPTVHRLELLGGFRLLATDGEPVVLPKKARALLAYLVVEDGRPQPRDRLAALLWEESSEEQARASLRQALAAIRRAAAPADWLLADGEMLGLDMAALESDVARFLALAGGDAVARAEAAALYRGDLLEGLHFSESGFSAWAAAERARLRNQAVGLLEQVAEAALAERRTDSALAHAGRLLALDPLHEPATRLVMRAQAQAGRHAEVLRQYRTLQQALRRELGVAPEAATVALHAELSGRRGELPEAAALPETQLPPATAPRIDPMAAAVPATAAPGAPRREIRRLGVLSVGIAGYAQLSVELDVERLYALIEAWHGAVDEEVQRAGGVVHDRMGDTAIAVFGRDQARDDDPVRAASAAFHIHRRVAGIGVEMGLELKARAGLAAGRALFSEGPHEAAIVGEPVTMASTLRARAEAGETLATAGFAAEAGPQVQATRGPDGLYVLTPLPTGVAAGEAMPPLVGRAAELGQLEGLCRAAAGGAGMAVCLRGDPGIGKTRLVETLAARARAAGWSVHRAQIADFGSLAQVTPRRQLTRSLLGLGAAQAGDLPADGLAAALGERHRPWLYQLAGLPAPAGLQARQEAEAPEAGPAARAAAFRALLEAAGDEAPLLLVVEDVHWAGGDALGQLAELTRQVAGRAMLLLLTTRPEPDRLDLAWRAAAGPMLTIDLKPLSLAESLALAHGIGAGSDEDALVCVVRADGNPLFLTQLVACVTEGASADTALPGSVESLALGRMDRLDPDERQALRAAAVLGPRADLEAVAAVAGVPGYAPSGEAAGSLVTTDGRTLSFLHALMRDAVYQSLLEAERRALHRAAATFYVARDPDLAAAHLAAAADEAAPEAYAEAAAAALARHRPDKALDAAAQGLALAATPEARLKLLLVKAQAEVRTLALDAAVATAREAQALAPDHAGRAQALLMEGTALAAAQKGRATLEVLAAAEREALAGGEIEGGPLAELMARLQALRGNIHFPRGELEACLEAHRQSRMWAQRAGTPLAEAGALVGLAWAHYQRGDFEAATGKAGDALALGGEARFDRIRLAALRVRAVSRIFLLEHAEALADAREAIALAEAQDDPINALLARTTAGTVHLERWEHEEALAVVAPALGLDDRLGDTGLQAAPLWVRGTALGAMGEVDEGIRTLELARDHGLKGQGIRFAVPRILGTLAFFVDPAARAALAAEGEAMLAKTAVAHSAFGFYGSLVHAALRNAEWDLAEHCAAGLRRFSGAAPPPWAAAMLALAQHFAALGRGTASAEDQAAAARLHQRARRTPALFWLRPSMRAVEARARDLSAAR